MIPHHHYYKKPQDNNKYMDPLRLVLMLVLGLVLGWEHIGSIGMIHIIVNQLFLLKLVLYILMVPENQRLLFLQQKLLHYNNTCLLYHTHKYYMVVPHLILLMLFDTAFDNKYQHLYNSKILLWIIIGVNYLRCYFWPSKRSLTTI